MGLYAGYSLALGAGTLVDDMMGWKSAYLLAAVTGFVVAAVTFFTVPEPRQPLGLLRRRRAQRHDYSGVSGGSATSPIAAAAAAAAAAASSGSIPAVPWGGVGGSGGGGSGFDSYSQKNSLVSREGGGGGGGRRGRGGEGGAEGEGGRGGGGDNGGLVAQKHGLSWQAAGSSDGKDDRSGEGAGEGTARSPSGTSRISSAGLKPSSPEALPCPAAAAAADAGADADAGRRFSPLSGGHRSHPRRPSPFEDGVEEGPGLRDCSSSSLQVQEPPLQLQHQHRHHHVQHQHVQPHRHAGSTTRDDSNALLSFREKLPDLSAAWLGSPALLLVCVAGGVRDAGGFVFGYYLASYFSPLLDGSPALTRHGEDPCSYSFDAGFDGDQVRVCGCG